MTPPPAHDSPPPTTPPRSRPRGLAALLLVILTGLASRSAPAQHLPPILSKHLGDFLWPIAFYLALLVANPRLRPATALAASLLFAIASEFLKLLHPPPLDALRAHPLPRLLLGTRFIWPNLATYTLGAVAAWTIDRRAARTSV